jgi:hypothetical protein
LPTTIYALESDFRDHQIATADLAGRVKRAAAEFADLITATSTRNVQQPALAIA